MTEDTAGPATWAVLRHEPADGRGAGVFADPRFGDHVAFLRRLVDEGLLVAAGPLPDVPGAGMTIVRLPGPGRLEEIADLARTADPSVTGGLLAVAVEPWDVRMVG